MRIYDCLRSDEHTTAYNSIHSIQQTVQFLYLANIKDKNSLLQQVIEGKIKGRMEVTGRRGRRRRKLLGDLMEREDTLI
jgi:hypothetical protein